VSDDTLPLFEDDDVIAARFASFHSENPHVYRRLRSMALNLRRRGRERYGIAALVEVFRYESAATNSDDGLKLNNNYSALYARLLEQQEPELRGFFSMRQRKARHVDGQIVHPGDNPSPAVDCFDHPNA